MNNAANNANIAPYKIYAPSGVRTAAMPYAAMPKSTPPTEDLSLSDAICALIYSSKGKDIFVVAVCRMSTAKKASTKTNASCFFVRADFLPVSIIIPSKSITAKNG